MAAVTVTGRAGQLDKEGQGAKGGTLLATSERVVLTLEARRHGLQTAVPWVGLSGVVSRSVASYEYDLKLMQVNCTHGGQERVLGVSSPLHEKTDRNCRGTRGKLSFVAKLRCSPSSRGLGRNKRKYVAISDMAKGI